MARTCVGCGERVRMWDGVCPKCGSDPKTGRILVPPPGSGPSEDCVVVRGVVFLGGPIGMHFDGEWTRDLVLDREYVWYDGHKVVPIRDVAGVDVSSGQAAVRKIAAVVVFGLLGGLAAKGAVDRSVIILHLRDGGRVYFQLMKKYDAQVRATIGPFLRELSIPWHEDAEDAQDPSALGDQLAKLAELRTAGMLTEDEFAAAKLKLLS